MTKKKRKSTRPRQTFGETVPNYYGLNPKGLRQPPKELYVNLRSALWWDKGMRYVRAYHELLDLYVVRRGEMPPLLGTEHVGLWLLLVRWQQRKRIFTMEELAGELEIDLKTLRLRLNRLADVKLIHFERCWCQGRPIDIILHTPLRASQLTLTMHGQLWQRVLTNYTQGMRDKLGQDFPGIIREVGDMIPGSKAQKEKIRKIVLYLNHVEREDDGYNAAFWVAEFKKLCKTAKIEIDQRHVRAAIVLKKQLERGEITEPEVQRIEKILRGKTKKAWK
jgi:hypothetical protein